MNGKPRAELTYHGECEDKHVLAEVVVNKETMRREFVVRRMAAGAVGLNGRPRDRSQGAIVTPLEDVPPAGFPVMCACNRTYLLSGSRVPADHRAGVRRVFLPPIAS